MVILHVITSIHVFKGISCISCKTVLSSFLPFIIIIFGHDNLSLISKEILSRTRFGAEIDVFISSVKGLSHFSWRLTYSFFRSNWSSVARFLFSVVRLFGMTRIIWGLIACFLSIILRSTGRFLFALLIQSRG